MWLCNFGFGYGGAKKWPGMCRGPVYVHARYTISDLHYISIFTRHSAKPYGGLTGLAAGSIDIGRSKDMTFVI